MSHTRKTAQIRNSLNAATAVRLLVMNIWLGCACTTMLKNFAATGFLENGYQKSAGLAVTDGRNVMSHLTISLFNSTPPTEEQN